MWLFESRVSSLAIQNEGCLERREMKESDNGPSYSWTTERFVEFPYRNA